MSGLFTSPLFEVAHVFGECLVDKAGICAGTGACGCSMSDNANSSVVRA
jgi:hypothetical protein